MSEQSMLEWRRNSRDGLNNRYEGRRDAIARAARVCFERKSIAKTSIADITREVDITRELFYYYFANKGAVVNAVVGLYLDEAVALCDERIAGATDVLDALRGVVGAYRQWLLGTEPGDEPLAMVSVLRETGLWDQVAHRVALETITSLREAGFTDVGEQNEERLLGCAMGLAGAVSVLAARERFTDETIARSLLPLF